MTRNLAVTTCLVACISAMPVLAQGNAAKQQMADELGVSVNDYSTMELVQLRCRLEAADSDADRDRILQEVKGYGEPMGEASEAEKAQLASNLGVNAEDFTTEQLVYLRQLVESNDCTAEEAQRYMAEGEEYSTAVAGAKAQLAAACGAPAEEHTLVELVRMKFEAECDETN